MKKNPPSKYPNITEEQWKSFKKNRASERFKAISERNHANIAKKESKYYGSRGGYRLIEDILKKEQGVEEVERHMTYKAGHTPKGDRVGTKFDTKIISNIEEVLKEVEVGDFIPKGRGDILARAIGRPEHPGRLRGVPLHVGVTKYYGKTTAKKNKKKTRKYTDEMVQVLVSVILKMNAGGKPSEEELKMMEDIIKKGKEQEKIMLAEEADKADVVVAEKETDMVVTEDMVVAEKETDMVVAEKETEMVAAEKETEMVAVEKETDMVITEKVEQVQKRVAVLTHPSLSKTVGVAAALVYIHDTSSDRITVHCVPLLKNHRKVLIAQIFPGHENLQLPIPVRDELIVLKDAVKCFVQWPCQHIYFKPQGPKKTDNKEPKDHNIPRSSLLPKHQVGGMKKTDKEDSTTITRTSATSLAKNQDEDVDVGTSTKPNPHYFPQLKVVRSLSSKPEYTGNKYKAKVRTMTLDALYKEAERLVETEQLIIILLDDEILGKEVQSVVSWEILAIWTGLLEIDVQHLYAWIKYLKSRVIIGKNIPMDNYGFLCPFVLSLYIKAFEYEDRVDYIARQLATGKKLFLAPYNEDGRHWVLAAIMPVKKQIFWLDSLHGQPTETFKKLINSAFTKKATSSDSEQTETDTSLTFITISGVSQQPDDKQCGYYVCRFMFEIITRRYIVIPERYNIMNHSHISEYTNQEIDEVRDFWGKFVLQHRPKSN
ncbi:hypothetical protein RND81_05G029800 [Saponaria officinalis]|uniref:Ubiquitin-like protease family profile domain-containing protein n=1 Tax=Saponaria officinalis TaxID=3572 RepID=A0AAW1KTM8_SAPOF